MIAIAKIYKRKIIKGERTFASVPNGIKAEVRKLLIEAGREDLVKED